MKIRQQNITTCCSDAKRTIVLVCQSKTHREDGKFKALNKRWCKKLLSIFLYFNDNLFFMFTNEFRVFIRLFFSLSFALFDSNLRIVFQQLIVVPFSKKVYFFRNILSFACDCILNSHSLLHLNFGAVCL